MLNQTNTTVLPNGSDKEHLKVTAPLIVAACPGLQDEAHAIASEILKKYGISDIDPDQVWWHRFDNVSASSTKAFLGWEHAPQPSESLTLTQLVIHRYRVTDQDNADLLDSDGGFYNQDAHASLYNETNEVRMYPSQVLKDLWRLNLSDRYLSKMHAFWSTHFEDYRTLAKCNFLSKAVEARQNGQLEEEDFQTVIKAAVGDLTWPITLAGLQAKVSTTGEAGFFVLDVAGHVATDILRIVGRDGRQITYVPGAAEAFHVHPKPADLHWWILLQMNDDTRLAEFMTHFPVSERQAINDNITPLMDQLVSTWGKSDHHLINQKTIAISGDTFTWLSRSVQSTMQADADLTLISNGQMRKQLWLGYLTVGLHVFGPLAMLGWPIALPVIGASLAAMGLNIDKAVNGKTAEARKAGVIGAVLAGINTLFNIPLLKGVGALEEVGASVATAEAVEMAELKEVGNPVGPGSPEEPRVSDGAQETPSQVEGLTPVPGDSGSPVEVPEHWQSNDILESEPLADSGKFQGVYTLNSNPPNAIMMNDTAYYVRYESDVNGGGSWAIIDPKNPNAFSGSMPVRLNAQGEWELTPRAGLKGGGKEIGEPVPGTSQSASQSRPPSSLRSPSTKYDAPGLYRLRRLALGIKQTHFKVMRLPDGSMKGISDYEEHVAPLRTRLTGDTRSFYSRPDFFASLPARPVLPVITPSTTVTDLLEKIFEAARGLVVGESRDRIASMRFLIENMQTLARQGVKTIYLHRLLNDVNQFDLDAFTRTGEISTELEKYLNQLQSDPSGQFTPLKLVRIARQHGIRIQATDCLASYKYEGASLSDTAEQSIKNYLTNTIIHTNESLNGSGKWVVLTGQENTNTFRGIAGISEMNGGIGLRVEEVLPELSPLIEVDPGIDVGRNLGPAQQQMHGDFDTLYADLSIKVPLPMLERTAADYDRLLFRQGMFTLKDWNGAWTLIHRSRDGQIMRTLIERTADGGYLINRPSWPDLHQIPYANIGDLTRALTGIGLKLEGRLPL